MSNPSSNPSWRVCLVPGCLAFAALVGGCQKEPEVPAAPIEPQALAAQVGDDTKAVFQSIALSVDGVSGVGRAGSRAGEGFTTISGALSEVGGGGGSMPGQMPAIAAPSSLARFFRSVPAMRATARPLASESFLGPSPIVGPNGVLYATQGEGELASDVDETGEALARLIKERLLVPANLESQTASEAIYLLRADPTCRDLDSNELDKKCADQLGKVEVRVRMSKVGDATALDLMFGSERARPFRLSIASTQIAFEMHLGDVKTTAAILAKALGSKDDTPDVLKGALRWALTKEGPKKASISAGIIEALEVANQARAGQDPITIKSAASDPVFKLTADGEQGVLTGALNLGATEVLAPWKPKSDTPPNQDARYVLAGATGEVTFTEATDKLTFKRLGYGPGPSFFDLKGKRIVQYDLNPNDGRAVDFDISFDAAGNPRFSYAPRYEMRIAVNFGMADFADAPDFVRDETYSFVFDKGGAGAPTIGPWKPAQGGEGGLKMLVGSFALAAEKAGAKLTVPEGQCLVADQQPAAGAHPLVGAFKATPCP